MTNVNPFPDDPSQPRPVRIATWLFGVILAVLGLLPLFGVALSAEAIGGVALVLGVLLPGVGLLVERQVTPLSSPRSINGKRLIEVSPGGGSGVNPLDAGRAL
jgi:hypothetical protein